MASRQRLEALCVCTPHTHNMPMFLTGGRLLVHRAERVGQALQALAERGRLSGAAQYTMVDYLGKLQSFSLCYAVLGMSAPVHLEEEWLKLSIQRGRLSGVAQYTMVDYLGKLQSRFSFPRNLLCDFFTPFFLCATRLVIVS